MSTDRGMSYPETVHWQQRGLCKDVDLDLFNSREHGERAETFRDRLAAAKGVCASCPVQVECAEDAASNHGAGIRAGMYWISGQAVAAPTKERSLVCVICHEPLPDVFLRTGRATCGSVCAEQRRRRVMKEPVCGTVAGVMRHRRADEKPCPACRKAKTRAEKKRVKRLAIEALKAAS